MTFDYFNLHTHQKQHEPKTVSLVNQYPQEFEASVPHYSIGIHPWYINKSQIETDLEIITENCSNKAMLAVGECGLDKRIEQDFDLQISVFKSQLLIAQAFQKPVILHCVGAFQEVMAIKKELKIDIPIVVHGFSKNIELSKQLITNGFYLSFGKYLIQNPKLKDVFVSIPNDRFFLETDLLDLKIEDIYKLASQYKEMDLVVLQEMVKNNFKSVFKLQ
jgi:TatD DNase family protein